MRAVHEFALRAIDCGADTASELGRRLLVSKQAAAKTIAAVHVAAARCHPDPFAVSGCRVGFDLDAAEPLVMAIASALFDDVRERWPRKSALSNYTPFTRTSANS